MPEPTHDSPDERNTAHDSSGCESQPGRNDLPKPLPDDVIRAWEKNGT